MNAKKVTDLQMGSLAHEFAEVFGINGLRNRMQNAQKNYLREKIGKMLAGRMYDDYRREHPECTGRYSSCCNCGGSRIWANKLIPALDGSVSEHCCRDCGEQLFFSITGNMLKELLASDNTQYLMPEPQNAKPLLESENNQRPADRMQPLSLHPPKA